MLHLLQVFFDINLNQLIHLGFKQVRLLPEPVAAALCFGLDRKFDGMCTTVLVFDFGGGTLDVCVIEIVKSDVKHQFEVLSSTGDNHLVSLLFFAILLNIQRGVKIWMSIYLNMFSQKLARGVSILNLFQKKRKSC
jgi:hypothetical protein